MSQFEEQPQTDTNVQLLQPKSAGSILAAHREEAGMSLEEVAGQLKLAKRQIEALEQDRFDALPGNTFVRGFVRNYARLLHIDPQPLLNDLATRLPAEAPQAALPRLQDEAMPMLRPSAIATPQMSSVILVVLALLLIAGGGAWFYLNNRHEPQIAVDVAPPNAAAPVTSPATLAPDVDKPVDVAMPAGDKVVETTDAAQAQPQPNPASPILAPHASSDAIGVPPAGATALPTMPPLTPQTSAAAVAPLGPNQDTAARGDEVRVVAKADTWVQVVDANGKHLISELVKAGDSRSASGKPPYQVKIGNGPKTELYYRGQLTDLSTHLKVDVATLELK
jgi:cytoskeleton protein RodZ